MTGSVDVRQRLHEREQTFGAVILAGGLARRMGGDDKGLVELAGKPMVHYALTAILPLVDRVVVNANRNQDSYERIAASAVSLLHTKMPFLSTVEVVEDKLPGHLGPLAGLSAAIEVLETDYILMCPCDSPFLQPDFVEALLRECVVQDADIAVGHDGERLQPVFCVVNKRVKASLDDFLVSGQRKIDRWFDKQQVYQISACDFAASFVNINTEEERLKAEQVLLS